VSPNLHVTELYLHHKIYLTEILVYIYFSKNTKILLLCCYIVSSINNETFERSLNSLKCFCNSIDCSICIFGDFNLPLINWSSLGLYCNDFKSNLFLDFINGLGFIQYVSESTRDANILDLVLCNDPFLITSLVVCLPFCTSDHSSIEFNFVFNNNVNVGQCVNYLWHKTDWSAFAQIVNNVDWVGVFASCSCSDGCWSVFLDVITNGINNYVPRIARAGEGFKLKHSKEVNKLASHKKASWKHLKSNYTPENLSIYKHFSKAHKAAIETDKINSEHAIISSGNTGSFYKYINQRMNHKTGIAPLTNETGEIVLDNFNKAILFGNYFASVGVDDNGLTPNLNLPFVHYVSNSFGSTLNLIYFSEVTVFKVLSKMHNSLTAGPDNIPPILFKNLAGVLCGPLSYFFNLVMQNGSVPNGWKSSIVVPILRKELHPRLKTTGLFL